MAVRIRLARAGAKKAPFYRIVVADSRAPRDGRFIEILGRYNPRTNPSTIEVDVEKAEAWLAKGALPSETVEKLIAIAKNPEASAPVRAAGLSKKAAAKAAAEQAKAAEPTPEPEPVVEEAPIEEPVADEPAAEEAPVEEAAAEESVADEPAEEPAAEATDDEAAE